VVWCRGRDPWRTGRFEMGAGAVGTRSKQMIDDFDLDCSTDSQSLDIC